MPAEANKVASIARLREARVAAISASRVSPSSPQLDEKFASCPSRLSSPFASLCFSS